MNQDDKKIVYISGPITGLSREEYMQRFAVAEDILRAQGYEVVNPTRLAPCRWPWLFRLIGYKLTLLYDLWHLWHCQYICLLPGYGQSRGALIELSVSYHMGVHELPDDIISKVHKAMLRYYRTRNINLIK